MKKFEVGKTYYTRSACDYDCIFSFTVTKRTAKTVTFTDKIGKQYRRKIYDSSFGEKEEIIFPYGSYSMSPCVGATDDYIKG